MGLSSSQQCSLHMANLTSDTMQSSVRTEAPCLVSKPSISSVHIKEEVSVVSIPAPTPTKKRRSLYTTTPSLPNLHTRAQTSSGPIEHKSTTNRHDVSSRLSNRSSAGINLGPHYGEQEDLYTSDILVENSESMKALADFLMTKDPPPSNWISATSDDDKSMNTFKKSALKVFGKHKRRKSNQTKLLQLPDSAVSAKTRNGTRHIAISIPIEHDYPQVLETQIRSPQRSQSQPNLMDKLERPDSRAVVVLKPVVEARESLFSNPPSLNRQSISTPPRAMIERRYSTETPPAEVLDVETTKTLQNYYTQLNYQQRRLKHDGANNAKPEPPRTPRSYVAVSPDKTRRPNSLGSGSDPRHSGGTTYSITSIASVALGHSRAPSNVSTAASSVPISDLPKRQTSVSKPKTPVVVLPIAKTLNDTQTTNNGLWDNQPNQSLDETLTSQKPPSVPIVFETATEKFARSRSGSRNSGLRPASVTTPSQPGPPPTTSLPDIPMGFEPSHSRPSTAPHLQTLSSISQVSQTRSKRSGSLRDGRVPVQPQRSGTASNNVAQIKRSLSAKDVVEETHSEDIASMGDITEPESFAKSARETRQERVKALRQRDIAAARGKATSPTPLFQLPTSPSELLETVPQAKSPPAPQRNPKRRSLSTDRIRTQAANTLTPILLVANIHPIASGVASSDMPSLFRSQRSSLSSKESASACKQTKRRSPTTTLRPRSSEYTSRYSMTSSVTSNDDGNDSDTIPSTSITTSNHRRPRHSRSLASLTPSVAGSAAGSVLERRREERRTNRNMNARDRTYEERLCKLERENKMLMTTLAGIARSFGGLISNETSEASSEKCLRSGSTGCVLRKLEEVTSSSGNEQYLVDNIDVMED